MYRDRKHLAALADRCDAGADQLIYEAEHAAEVLATRANGNRIDPQEWAARKQAAAAAARQYAEGLRAEAAGMSEGDRPSKERIRQAEKVADAAGLGGILIDGGRLAEAAAANPFHHAEMRRAIEEHQQAETEAVAGSGVFGHVAEQGQVPYWQLGATRTANDTPAPVEDTTNTADGPPIDNLNGDQARLCQQVLDAAGTDGSDCRDVLLDTNAPAADKAAVAEVLGGPGAGVEFSDQATSSDAPTSTADDTDDDCF
jgi:hypothetical protein